MQHTDNTDNTAYMSLGQFERAYNVNRGTVSRKAKTLGYDTSNGLSKEAHDQLCEFFKVGKFAEPQTTAIDAEIVGAEPGQLTTYQGTAHAQPMIVFNFGNMGLGHTQTDTTALDQNTAGIQEFKNQLLTQALNAAQAQGESLGRQKGAENVNALEVIQATYLQSAVEAMGKKLGTVQPGEGA